MQLDFVNGVFLLRGKAPPYRVRRRDVAASGLTRWSTCASTVIPGARRGVCPPNPSLQLHTSEAAFASRASDMRVASKPPSADKIDTRLTSQATPLPGQVVLVLQGGGALGAYQAGVYQALHEAGIEPDWIIGTSIGAINASLIAGNEAPNRLPRLEEFWDRMADKAFWHALAAWAGTGQPLSYWKALSYGVPGFFEPNPLAFLGPHMPLGADRAGYYSTAPLERTLLELVDFSVLNRGRPRLTVGAAHVRTSRMRYFDSRDGELGVKHIMASGALPPAFPAVRIDGELYWDGGILSNTPTEVVFDDAPRRSSLIFAVHMWNPIGPEPRRSGRCSTGKKTSNTPAGSRTTLRASWRSTGFAMSSASLPSTSLKKSAAARPFARWPASVA